MARLSALVYGTVSYLLFLIVFLYLIGFLGNFLVPKSVDIGEGLAGSALLINLGLIALFGVQHTVMARQGFKHWWTQFVPKPVERSTYVLITSLLLIFFYAAWQPMTGIVWSVESQIGAVLLWSLFAAGWLLVLASTFMINHFELFGLKQVVLHYLQKVHVPPAFQVKWLYRIVRHPLYVGWITAFWATPLMTTGHLLFAAGMTIYILIAIHYEEKDLADFHGQAYEEYRAKVAMLVPGTGKIVASQDAAPSDAENQPAV